jgi:hypothetical protein
MTESSRFMAGPDLLAGRDVPQAQGVVGGPGQDANEQDRRGTVSVFNGPEPTIRTFTDIAAETRGVAEWIKETIAADIAPSEIGLFV